MIRYLWQIIQAEKRENKKEVIKISDRHSIYEVVDNNKIDILYRFNKIFKNYLMHKVEYMSEYSSFNEEEYIYLENEILHFLGEVDLLRGSSKKGFIINQIINVLLEEIDLKNFNLNELEIIAHYYYKVKKIGDDFRDFVRVVEEIFGKVKLYHMEGKILMVINQYKNIENLNKYRVLEDIFLDLTVKVRVFWKYPFGIIGENETMLINSIEIY